MDLLQGCVFTTPSGESVGGECLSGRLVALFFGAAWCPACREFTKLLRKLHTDLGRRRSYADHFRLVYAGADRNEAERAEFVKEHGDWLLLDHEDPVTEQLQERYNITMVPKLVVLAPTGDAITLKGRKEVQDRGVTAFRLWADASAELGARLSLSPSLAPSRSDLLDPFTRTPTPAGRTTPGGSHSPTSGDRLTPGGSTELIPEGKVSVHSPRPPTDTRSQSET